MCALHCSISVPHVLYHAGGFPASMTVHTCSLWEQEQKLAVRAPRAGSARATFSLGARPGQPCSKVLLWSY